MYHKSITTGNRASQKRGGGDRGQFVIGDHGIGRVMRLPVFDAVLFSQEFLGANLALVIAFKVFVNGENVALQTVLAGEITVALVTVERLARNGGKDLVKEKKRSQDERCPIFNQKHPTHLFAIAVDHILVALVTGDGSKILVTFVTSVKNLGLLVHGLTVSL